jgi:hypothetical protein
MLKNSIGLIYFFRYHKKRIISWLAKWLLTSEEGLFSMELVKRRVLLKYELPLKLLLYLSNAPWRHWSRCFKRKCFCYRSLRIRPMPVLFKFRFRHVYVRKISIVCHHDVPFKEMALRVFVLFICPVKCYDWHASCWEVIFTVHPKERDLRFLWLWRFKSRSSLLWRRVVLR